MKFLLPLFLVMSFLASMVLAQSADSNPKALRILRDAFQTLGGEANLKSFNSIFVKAKGVEHRSAEVQGYYPEKQTTVTHEEKLAIFMDGKKLGYEFHTGRHDGTMRWRRTIFTAERLIFADFIAKTASASSLSFPSLERTQFARSLPPTFLQEVSANSELLKYVEERTYENNKNDVISLQFPTAKTPIFLYFDSKTHLLSKYEYSVDFPGLGKTSVEHSYSDYRRHPKLGWFPNRYTIKVGGEIYRTMNYEAVLVDSPQAAEMLQLPPELEGFIALPGSVKEIAKGVYLVYRLGGYQPVFIEFKDFILAVEAPAVHPNSDENSVESLVNPDALSKEFIAKIKQTIKNKPIKFIVPTHFHSDHAGGVRAFITEGATVLTTSGNQTFFEKFAPNLKIETFANKKIISDGERIVELINVGANPHTAENIVVYLPQEKYLYQGDLFYYNGEATFPIRRKSRIKKTSEYRKRRERNIKSSCNRRS